MIKIWKFEDAPSVYQNKSECCGDEDWVIFVPKEYEGDFLLEDDSYNQTFGWLSRYEVDLGSIFVGSHS